MRIFLCLMVVGATLTACEHKPVELESTFTVSLPISGGYYEVVDIVAKQNRVDVEGQKISDIHYRFVLEPEVSTEIKAEILETTKTSQTTVAAGDSLQSQTEEFIDFWVAWDGTTGEFVPDPGINDRPLIFPEADTTAIQFHPVMEDSDGTPHGWLGAWPGVEVKDTYYDITLSLPLAQNTAVPSNRAIEYRGKHPLGEDPSFQTINTEQWGAGSTIRVSLGAAPAALPVEKLTQVSPESLPGALDYGQIYQVQGYSFSCSLPGEASPGSAYECAGVQEWIPCGSLIVPTLVGESVSVCVRYEALPSLGVSKLVLRREIEVQGPAVSITLGTDDNHQFLEVGEGGWSTTLEFIVSSDEVIVPVGTPLLEALEQDGDEENTTEIAGMVCVWLSDEPGMRLKVGCTPEPGVVSTTFHQSVAVLEVKYALASDPSNEFADLKRFRVLGLTDSTNRALVTSVLPAHGLPSTEANLARYWVQVAVLVRESPVDKFRLSIESALLAGTDNILAQTGESKVFNIVWELGASETVTTWVSVDLLRDTFPEGFGALAKRLSITVEETSAAPGTEPMDIIQVPARFITRAPSFLPMAAGQALRYSSDFNSFGISQSFQWPVTGFGANRGGYMFASNATASAVMTSSDGLIEPLAALDKVAGVYEVSLGVLSRYNQDSDYVEQLESAAKPVQLVEPSQPASLAFGKLNVGGQTFDVNLAVLGQLQRLVWDPLTENLVVVGEDGFELFRHDVPSADGTDPQWRSLGVIAASTLSPVCPGKIADATLALYPVFTSSEGSGESTNAWYSSVAYLSFDDDQESTLHCSLSLAGMVTQEAIGGISQAQVKSFPIDDLGTGDCFASFNSVSASLAHNPLNKTYWAMSGNCLLGYTVDQGSDPLSGTVKASRLNSMWSDPSGLTIEPHSSTAIAEFWDPSAGRKYQRLKLVGELEAKPGFGSAYSNRDGILFDPVRGWNWEVTNVSRYFEGSILKDYYWMPSVGLVESEIYPMPSTPSDGSTGTPYTAMEFGMNDLLLDSSRDFIHSLELNGFGEANRVSKQIHQIVDNGNNMVAAGTSVVLYEEDPTVSGNPVWSGDPVVDIIMMGPQITGSLPHHIRPGERVTLLGSGFSADVSRDQVCVQGICVAPEWSTPNAMVFKVPEAFQSLDVPIKAFVTVDNGWLMSGPAPGESMLEKRSDLWGNPSWDVTYSLECDDTDPCVGGTILQGPTTVQVTVGKLSQSTAGHRIDREDGLWGSMTTSTSSFEINMSGSDSTTPAGRMTNLAIGLSGDNSYVTEARLFQKFVAEEASFAASEYFEQPLASSAGLSTRVDHSLNSLSAGMTAQSAFLSPEQMVLGVELVNPSELSLLIADRHSSSFEERPIPFADFSRRASVLPGLNGMITSSSEGAMMIQVLGDLGQTMGQADVSEGCGWPGAAKLDVFGSTGVNDALGLAVFSFSPFHVGVVLIKQNDELELECFDKEFETDVLPELYFKPEVSANGDMVAIAFANGDGYKLKVWSFLGELKEVINESLSEQPLDFKFSDSGHELYLALPGGLRVISFNKAPVSD